MLPPCCLSADFLRCYFRRFFFRAADLMPPFAAMPLRHRFSSSLFAARRDFASDGCFRHDAAVLIDFLLPPCSTLLSPPFRFLAFDFLPFAATFSPMLFQYVQLIRRQRPLRRCRRRFASC